MKRTAHMVGMLAGVSLVSGMVLVAMYQYAEPKIIMHQKEQVQAGVFTVLPDAVKYNTITGNGRHIYQGIDKNGNCAGYAFLAEGNGYQGTITLMVGMDVSLKKLTGMEVLENQETPGLGGRITEPAFKKQFAGVSVMPPIAYVLNASPEKPNEIQAITGATISSRSVVEILNQEIKVVRGIIHGER